MLCVGKFGRVRLPAAEQGEKGGLSLESQKMPVNNETSQRWMEADDSVTWASTLKDERDIDFGKRMRSAYPAHN